MKNPLLFFLILLPFSVLSQHWKQTPALETCGGNYLIAAANINSSVYVVDNQQIFGFSKDAGATWTRPSTTPSINAYVSLTGVGDRLYASKKITTHDYTLEYTQDDGTSWITDTIGMPRNITKSGKRSMNIRDMGNGYILAFDANTACTKKVTETRWTSITIDDIINIDVLNHKGTWIAIGPTRILKSTDQGKSWYPLNTVGLPASFQGFKFASNQIDKLYITSGPQSGGQIIYWSEDDGLNWTATNSAGIYTHFGANVGAIHAVDDYVFAAISPALGDIKNPPPYILSSTKAPNFSVGDTSGMLRESTNAPLPFFFHIENKLFTMFWELYSSEPGFEGKQTASLKVKHPTTTTIFPNPVADILYVENQNSSNWSITTYLGKEVMKGYSNSNFNIALSHLQPNIYFLYINNSIHRIIKH